MLGQDNWWQNDKPIGAPPAADPGSLMPVTPPKAPPPQTSTQAAIDQANLQKLTSENEKLKDDEIKRRSASKASSLEAARNVFRSAQTANGQIGESGWGTTGITGHIGTMIPGSTANDLRANIDTLKANLAFSELSKMRQDSPTGGAVGQVSDADMRLLSSTVASLDADKQSPEQLKRNIQTVVQHYQDLLKRLGYSDDDIKGVMPPPPADEAEGRRKEVAGLNAGLSFDPGKMLQGKLEAATGVSPTGFDILDENGGIRLNYAGGKTQDMEQAPAEFRNSEAYTKAYRDKFGKDPPLAVDVPSAPIDQVNEARAKAADQEKYGGHLPESIREVQSEPLSEVGSAARSLVNTVGVGIPNAADAVFDSLTSGKSFGDALKRQRANDAAAWRVNPIPSTIGTVAGALALPTRSGAVAAIARDKALTNGAAIADVVSSGRNAAALQLAKEGGIYGTVYGTSENLDKPNPFAYGAVSGVLGATGGYAGGKIFGRIGDRSGVSAPPGGPAPVEGAPEAANALDIVMPRYVAGTPAQQQSAAALEKSPFGVGPIRKAQETFLDSGQAARDKIAGDLGNPAEDAAVGDAAREGLQAWRKSSKTDVNGLYNDAKQAIGTSKVAPTETTKEVRNLIKEEGQALVSSPAMSVLSDMANGLENAKDVIKPTFWQKITGAPVKRKEESFISVEGARLTRSTLRDALGETMTPSNADRITNRVMAAIQRDVERDAPKAAAAFKAADQAHAERMSNIRDVLEPFIGKKGDAWGSDVAAKLMSNAKSNGERLEEVLRLMPKSVADDVRATIISRLGQSRNGSQNAAGDAFSFDEFLTNWNQIRGARERIFPRETVRALNQLATVAEAAKVAGRARNFSNTGTITARDALMRPLEGAMVGGVGVGGATGSASAGLATAVGGVAFTLVRGLSQYLRANALSKPMLIRRIANTPETASAATRYWNGPWVDKMARADPSIAADLTGLRDYILQSLPARSAAGDSEEHGKAKH